jgi:hypothetical protein
MKHVRNQFLNAIRTRKLRLQNKAEDGQRLGPAQQETSAVGSRGLFRERAEAGVEGRST